MAIKSHLEKDLDRVFEQIGNIKFNSLIGMNNSSDVKSMIKKNERVGIKYYKVLSIMLQCCDDDICYSLCKQY